MPLVCGPTTILSTSTISTTLVIVSLSVFVSHFMEHSEIAKMRKAMKRTEINKYHFNKIKLLFLPRSIVPIGCRCRCLVDLPLPLLYWCSWCDRCIDSVRNAILILHRSLHSVRLDSGRNDQIRECKKESSDIQFSLEPFFPLSSSTLLLIKRFIRA